MSCRAASHCWFAIRTSRAKRVGQFIHWPKKAVELGGAFRARKAIVFAAVETERLRR
jgi:hypothetical protein